MTGQSGPPRLPEAPVTPGHDAMETPAQQNWAMVSGVALATSMASASVKAPS